MMGFLAFKKPIIYLPWGVESCRDNCLMSGKFHVRVLLIRIEHLHNTCTILVRAQHQFEQKRGAGQQDPACHSFHSAPLSPRPHASGNVSSV